MRISFPLCPKFVFYVLCLTAILWAPATIAAQENTSAKSRELYDQIKAFSLNGGSVAVKELVLTRDRAQMSFNGSFYFTAPIDGHVTGAVFIGEGKFAAAVPPNELGKGRLVEVGPIILGHRLSTRKTRGAYQTLIYNKGALVLRMLHFLLTDPGSGEGQAFFDMMTDFVNRYHDKFASTDDFRRVAGEHFAKSPIGRKYNLENLDWFFKEWVYRTDLPSYQMDYHVEDLPDGKFMLTGAVTQQNVPEDWFMPLPVLISFGGKQEAHGTVHALGPKANFQIKLPAKPTKVELDPDHWVLSERTSTKGP